MQVFRRIILMTALMFLAFPFAMVFAQDALPDLGGRVVTVAVENAYIPFNFIDDDTGEPDGWDYDALAEICARLNCVPEYIEQSWEGMIVAVSNGEYDLAAGGITVTDERKEIVAFSDGYVDVAQRMMVQLDEDRFASVADFVAGEYRIGVQVATTNYKAAEDLVGEGDRLVGYETFGFAVQALIAGDVDAVVMDDVAGQGYVGVNADVLRLLPEALTSEELAFIYPLDSDLIEPFNAALASMKADGALMAINRKWLGPEEETSMLPDLGGRLVTVAVENAYIPFNFIDDETGEADGWDYDALAEICARLNCVPEYIEQSWEGMIVAVSNGEYDLAAGGITVTDERKEIVAFSDGYIDVAQRMMVQLDEDRFASVADFVAGEYRIGVQVATTNYKAAEDLVGEGDRLVGYETFGFAVQALIAGDVDAVVMDDVAGQGYVGVNADVLRLLPEALTSEELAFIYPLDSDLIEPFNAALSSMKADGALEAINRKWGLLD